MRGRREGFKAGVPDTTGGWSGRAGLASVTVPLSFLKMILLYTSQDEQNFPNLLGQTFLS